MKHTEKYTFILRSLTLLLALALMLGCASLTAFAQDEADTEASPYVTWTHSGPLKGYDPTTEKTYSYSVVQSISSRLRFMPDRYYQYANPANMLDTDYTVTAPYHFSEFLLLDDGTLMATNSGKKTLTNLPTYRGGFTSYRLVDGSMYSTVSEDSFRRIANTYGKQRQEHTLFSLREATYYTVLGFDEDGWFGVPVAFIFEMEDGLYYADATRLTDDCFDEEGGLRPKSGVTLGLYPLDEEVTDEAYDLIKEISFQIPTYTYEDGSSMLGDLLGTPDSATTGMMYATVITLGLVLPIAPITLGLCLPHSKKMGYKKRWYLLTAMGGAWFLLGLLVLILTVVSL